MPIHTHIIPLHTQPLRLSDYGPGIFHGLPTKSAFKKAIKRKEIFVDDSPGTSEHIIKTVEKISLNDSDKKPGKLYHIHLDVHFEVEHLAVDNKPAEIIISDTPFPYALKRPARISYSLSMH